MKRKFKVKNSSIEGRGCFVIDFIKKGEHICTMKGQNLSIPELVDRYKSGLERISDPLQIEEKEYLDLDEPYICFNHSCEPNAAIVGKAELIAIIDITANQEITYDYSTTEWTSDDFGEYKEWSMKCNCGAEKCRGIVKTFPELPTFLQKMYIDKKMVQDFIVRKYHILFE